jgi:hypothetical protein
MPRRWIEYHECRDRGCREQAVFTTTFACRIHGRLLRHAAWRQPDNGGTRSSRQFPTHGFAKVVRNDNSSFNLTTAGRYLVQFTVTVTEAGQLVIALDSGVGFAEQPHAVYGRAATGSPIVGMAIITTTVANTVLRLQNPAANAAPLTITSAAGGVTPSTSHLLIIAL